MSDEPILFERHGSVGVIRFNRPRVLNAFSAKMFGRLLKLLESAGGDDRLGAVLLTGTGRAFSTGIDLRELGERTLESGTQGERETIETIQELTRVLVKLPKVVMAAVNGPAVGFGAELAVAADVRVAAEGATFSFPEVQRALFATGGSTYLLPRIVGSGRAAEWLLSGRAISADEALESGLVARLVPDERLLGEALADAGRIAANAPVAVGRLKLVLRESTEAGLEAALKSELEGAVECLGLDDFAEGIRSFLEKRPPRFTGD